jgi:hypothetical protein
LKPTDASTFKTVFWGAKTQEKFNCCLVTPIFRIAKNRAAERAKSRTAEKCLRAAAVYRSTVLLL